MKKKFVLVDYTEMLNLAQGELEIYKLKRERMVTIVNFLDGFIFKKGRMTHVDYLKELTRSGLVFTKDEHTAALELLNKSIKICGVCEEMYLGISNYGIVLKCLKRIEDDRNTVV